MALDREHQVRGRHAGAVVGNAHQPRAAAREHHFDAPGPRVERVLDEFFHGRSRPLHHLSGGDAVDDGFGELTDGHG